MNGPFWNSSGGRKSTRKLLFDQHIKKLKETDSLKPAHPLAALIRPVQWGDWHYKQTHCPESLISSQLHLISHIFHVSFFKPSHFWHTEVLFGAWSVLLELPAACLSSFSVAYFLDGNFILIFFIYIAEKLVLRLFKLWSEATSY